MPSADPELIFAESASGHVIGFTVPLHWTIENQLRDGKLRRVNVDGAPYEEPAADDDTGDGGTGGPACPPQPRRSASKADWAAHAVALGLCTPEEAAGLPRAALIELTTPPETHPPEV